MTSGSLAIMDALYDPSQTLPPSPLGDSPRRNAEYWGWYHQRPNWQQQPQDKGRNNTNNDTKTKTAAPDPSPRRVRSDPYSSVSALELGLHPRPFAELHAERAYLLQALQQHDRRATELFRRLPAVEEQIAWNDAPGKARRHRAWLKHRVNETVELEKDVLARLSELHVEIQCRERWCRLEDERARRGLRGFSAGEGGGGESGIFVPATTSFAGAQPQSWPAMDTSAYPCGWDGSYQHEHDFYADPVAAVDNQYPSFLYGGVEPQRSDAVWEEEAQDLRGEQSVPLDDEHKDRPEGRRWSLPSLQYTWAGTGEQDDEAHRCLGYCSPDRGEGGER